MAVEHLDSRGPWIIDTEVKLVDISVVLLDAHYRSISIEQRGNGKEQSGKAAPSTTGCVRTKHCRNDRPW